LLLENTEIPIQIKVIKHLPLTLISSLPNGVISSSELDDAIEAIFLIKRIEIVY
jgi:hypothetical protein